MTVNCGGQLEAINQGREAELQERERQHSNRGGALSSQPRRRDNHVHQPSQAKSGDVTGRSCGAEADRSRSWGRKTDRRVIHDSNKLHLHRLNSGSPKPHSTCSIPLEMCRREPRIRGGEGLPPNPPSS